MENRFAISQSLSVGQMFDNRSVEGVGGNEIRIKQRLSAGQFLDSRSVEGKARNLRKKGFVPPTHTSLQGSLLLIRKNKNVNINERACIEYEPIRQILSAGQIFDSRSVEGEEWKIDLP